MGHNKWHQLCINPNTNRMSYEYPKFKIRLIFKCFVLWVGIYIDQKERLIYIFPIPMFGFKIGEQYKSKKLKRETK